MCPAVRVCSVLWRSGGSCAGCGVTLRSHGGCVVYLTTCVLSLLNLVPCSMVSLSATLRGYAACLGWDFCPTLAGRAFALHVGALLLSCSSRQGAKGVVLRILSFDLSPEKIHQTSAILHQPWALRRAAEVMHRAMFLSNTRKVLLRPILENGTIRTAIKSHFRNQSTRLLTSGFVT